MTTVTVSVRDELMAAKNSYISQRDSARDTLHWAEEQLARTDRLLADLTPDTERMVSELLELGILETAKPF